MSLGQAINSALTGLRATQYGLSVVGTNVANADTPGYTRKLVLQSSLVVGGLDTGVSVDGVNRTLNRFVETQLNRESSGGAYADTRMDFLNSLDVIFGSPNGETSVDSSFSRLLSALDGLITAPESTTQRTDVLSSAQAFAQQLNAMSADIQDLRTQAEQQLADSVSEVNGLLKNIQHVNEQIMTAGGADTVTAGLLDQRDTYISDLATYMDIRVVNAGGNDLSIYTANGAALFNASAGTLAFDGPSTLDASSQWNADSTKRGVGTITLIGTNGSAVDLIASKSIRSGSIGALLEMRDQVLVQAQSQLDTMAAAVADQVSAVTVSGTAVTPASVPPLPAGFAGFDIDVAGLQSGNTIQLDWTNTVTGRTQKVTLVRVDDPAVLPLPQTITADPGDTVLGVDWSGGLGSVVGQLNSYFHGKVTVSNPTGQTLRFLDDGGAGTSNVNSVSAHETATSLAGQVALPLFVDGGRGVPYTGAISRSGLQLVGFAGRIGLNSAVADDPDKLVAYQPSTGSSDPTRPTLLRERLGEVRSYPGGNGIGTVKAPFSGTISQYVAEMLSYQGAVVDAGQQLSDSQAVVVNALKERSSDTSGVNIDIEMAQLLQLQNAYGANARVLTAAKDMIDLLMKM
jgi:flagellar hook-associated protein 1 FlgK